MSILYSTQGTKQLAAETSAADRLSEGALLTGTVRHTRTTYALSGSETTSDLIYMVKLPKGARVLAHKSEIVCEDPGTALAVDVGDLADADRYGSAIAISAGGAFPLDELTTAPLADYKVGDTAADTGWIVLKPTSVSTLTAGAKIVLELAFVMP